MGPGKNDYKSSNNLVAGKGDVNFLIKRLNLLAFDY
jgi:hypothetical protein